MTKFLSCCFSSSLFYYFWSVIVISRAANSTRDTMRLSGAHLIICAYPFPVCLTMVKNATGYIVDFYGVAPEGLNWLSRKYNFTYSIFQTDDTTIEPAGPNKPGFSYYLTNGNCDAILSSLTLTVPRLSKMYFTQYFMDGRATAVVPMPVAVQNIGALLKPFDSTVWTCVGLSLLTILIVLIWLNYRRFLLVDLFNGERKNAIDFNKSLSDISQYIIGVTLAQGGYSDNSMTSFKILAGIWCLVAFVLTSSYTCILVSFVTTPSANILGNSIDELALNPDVKIVVEKGLGSDIVFSNSRDSPDKSMVKIGEKLRAYPNSRCTIQKQCVDLVKKGSHAFIGGMFPAMTAMRNDFLLEGRCNLLLTSQLQSTFLPLAMGIRKSAGILEYFDRGILMMHEKGFIGLWVEKYSPDVRRCLDEGQAALDRKPKGKKVAITLSNLSGAFFVLGVGLCIGLLTLFAEHLLYFLHRKKLCPA